VYFLFSLLAGHRPFRWVMVAVVLANKNVSGLRKWVNERFLHIYIYGRMKEYYWQYRYESFIYIYFGCNGCCNSLPCNLGDGTVVAYRNIPLLRHHPRTTSTWVYMCTQPVTWWWWLGHSVMMMTILWMME
jgi:hypothetical protein